MKRRSIFAAVAMLVVSAIVLSSATYAWFEASNTATVTGLTATVSNTNSAIEVSGDNGSSWGSTLDFSSSAFTAKTVSTTLTPVDYVKPTSGNDITFISCSMSDDVITYASADVSAGSGYSVYTIKLRNLSTEAATITATPTGGQNTNFNFGINYGYILFNISAKATANAQSPTVAQYIYGTGGYTSLTADSALLTKTATSENNTIVDSADTGDLVAALGNEVTAGSLQNGSAMTFALAGSETAEITMYVWAEGQDVDCTGAFGNTGAISGGITFTAA